jgi:hypothetical protein
MWEEVIHYWRLNDPQMRSVIAMMAVLVLVLTVRWRKWCEFWTWGKEDEP